MASKSCCFSHDEKSSYSSEERLQLAKLVEQFKEEHLKEQETLQGKTRYDKKRKKHVPVVTHGNFVAKVVRKCYSDFLDKPNDDPQFCAAHSLATCCLANIKKLCDTSICQPKKHVLLVQEESQKPLKFGKSSLSGLLIFEKY